MFWKYNLIYMVHIALCELEIWLEIIDTNNMGPTANLLEGMWDIVEYEFWLFGRVDSVHIYPSTHGLL